MNTSNTLRTIIDTNLYLGVDRLDGMAEAFLEADEKPSVRLQRIFKESHGIDVEPNRIAMMRAFGDTHLGMSWDEFLTILGMSGFILGMERTYALDRVCPEAVMAKHEEVAVLFYHPTKGLVVYATSFSYGKTSPRVVNKAMLYGEAVPKTGVDTDVVRRHLYTCSFTVTPERPLEDGVLFSSDARCGLVNQIAAIEAVCFLMPSWTDVPDLWFLDPSEMRREDFSHRHEINRDRIAECPDDCQAIFGDYAR